MEVRSVAWVRAAVYGILLALGLAWSVSIVHRQGERLSDWLVFEIAARTFIHFQHNVVYAGNPFALYARNPLLQIGPPSWLPVAAFQWASPHTVNQGFGIVMVLLGLGAVAAVEGIAVSAHPDLTARRRLSMLLVLGGGVMVMWGYNIGRWHHLDDVIGLTFTAYGCWLIQRRKAWWLIGIFIGTAVAAKPWAIILTPVLIGLPREARSKATLATIVVAGAWWAPFILGSSGTIHALGSYPIPVHQGSVLWLFGLRGDVQHWLRPVQFLGGLALGVLIAKRASMAWLAAPLGALAFRVITDPFIWSYYGMGPVLFAFVWDMARGRGRQRWPLYTVATLAVEGLLPWLPIVIARQSFSAWALAVEWSKLAWGLAVIAGLLIETRCEDERGTPLPARLAASAV